MTNINRDAVGKALLRRVEASRLERYLKEPLEEIMTPLMKGDEIPLPGLIDIMMVLIFVHVNLLGYLYSKNDSAADAVKFFREYFGRIDGRYKEVGGLLYVMLRHGWIHRFTAKRLKLNDGMTLDFEYTFDVNREQHLIMTETQGTNRLLISLPVLYNDLLSAIDLYAEDIRHSQTLSDVFNRALETIREPEKEEAVSTRQYIQDSDFDFIRSLR
jgi:hypothetical protein